MGISNLNLETVSKAIVFKAEQALEGELLWGQVIDAQ